MTRYELIKKKANELCNDPANDYKSTEDLCIMMAEWADENPDINPDEEVLSKINSNAYKAWIEKACEWLNENMEDKTRSYEDYDVHDVVASDYAFKKEFIDACKKYMEEQ